MPVPPRSRPFAGAAAAGLPALIGCDEVGRGALCGPVVVAAVWFEPVRLPAGLLDALDDSKRLPATERERLYPLIAAAARVGFAARSAPFIDRHNIRQATLHAMRAAVARLALDAPVRIDGNDLPPGLAAAEAVVGGDACVPQIAAASIMAKVLRDRLMARLAARHASYGWHANAGYATAAHRAAIATHGATRHHRRSFGALLGGIEEG